MADIGPWIAASLLKFVGIVPLFVVEYAYFLTIWKFSSAATAIRSGRLAVPPSGPGGSVVPVLPPTPGLPSLPALGPGVFILAELSFLAIFLFSAYVTVGSWHMAFMQVKTGKAEFAQIFKAPNVWLKLLGAAALWYVLVLLSGCLCFLPSIYLGVALCMTPFLILDQKLGPVAAMQKSREAIHPQWVGMLVLLIVLYLITMLGYLACFVGILVTVPLVELTLAIVYRDLFLTERVTVAPAIQPRAPIADPFDYLPGQDPT